MKFFEQLALTAAKNSMFEPADIAVEDKVRTPMRIASHARGQGGMQAAMFGERKRAVNGSKFHGHLMECRSMNALLQPESVAQTRRAMTPLNNYLLKSSTVIGSGLRKQERKDPANLLKPPAEFRKATAMSMNNSLWMNDTDFNLRGEKQMSKNEMCKSRSHERYYKS